MSKKSPFGPSLARRRKARGAAFPVPTGPASPDASGAPVPVRRKKASGMAHKATSSRRPRGVHGTFGDLCEISEGLAVVWRRKGCTEREMWAFAEDAPSILCDVVPALHALGFGEEDVIRHVPHDGILASLLLGFSRLMTARESLTGRSYGGSAILALPPLVALAFLHRALSRRIATLRNKAARPMHYEAEKARRRAMAEERRRVCRRATTSPCPTKENLLEAWRHVRDSKESFVRFGSMVQDLECYVDNSLRMDEAGRIVGRNAGIKGWLRDNLPELAEHYSMVMRYKAAAKKLRQVVGLADPTPVAAVLAEDADRQEKEGRRGDGGSCDHGAEKIYGDGGSRMVDFHDEAHPCAGAHPCTDDLRSSEKRGGKAPPVEVVRARAVYLEAMEGVPDVAARVMARIDALCDPERLDEAATLRSWREKYEREITVRRKESWWRRLTA